VADLTFVGIRRYYFLILLLVPILFSFSLTGNVYALEQACPDCGAEGVVTAEEALLNEVSISIWTDKSFYDHESIILVYGYVENIRAGTPVTMTVISPSNNIVTQAQLAVDGDGNYETTLSTAGNLWKYDGTYTIRVQYGNEAVSNKVLVELTGGVEISQATPKPTTELEPESRLPTWVRSIFIWYAQDKISEDELINALQFLIRQGTIVV